MSENSDLNNNSEVLEKGQLLHERYRIERFLEVKRGANIYRAIDEVTNFVVILKEKVNNEFISRTSSLNISDKKYPNYLFLLFRSINNILK